MSKLLTERLTFDQAQLNVELSESETTGKKSLYMSGIFIQGGVRNHNKRIYPVSEIRSAVNEINSILESGESVLGEADHPEELNINLDRVSHMITKMWMEDNNGMGKLKIVPTPMGEIIRVLIESGAKLGVSSRGSGDVDYDGRVSNFSIVTVDIVAKPSAPNAYPRTVYEALNGRRGNIISDLAVASMHDINATKYLRGEMEDWIKGIK